MLLFGGRAQQLASAFRACPAEASRREQPRYEVGQTTAHVLILRIDQPPARRER